MKKKVYLDNFDKNGFVFMYAETSEDIVFIYINLCSKYKQVVIKTTTCLKINLILYYRVVTNKGFHCIFG